jgi:hypothetical protein
MGEKVQLLEDTYTRPPRRFCRSNVTRSCFVFQLHSDTGRVSIEEIFVVFFWTKRLSMELPFSQSSHRSLIVIVSDYPGGAGSMGRTPPDPWDSGKRLREIINWKPFHPATLLLLLPHLRRIINIYYF